MKLVKSKKKFFITLGLIMLLCFSFAAVASAGGTGSVLNPNDTTGLKTTVENASQNFATLVRYLFGFIAAVFLIWGAVLLVTAGGDSQKIATAKDKFKYTLGAVVIVILADKIVGAVYGLFV